MILLILQLLNNNYKQNLKFCIELNSQSHHLPKTKQTQFTLQFIRLFQESKQNIFMMSYTKV